MSGQGGSAERSTTPERTSLLQLRPARRLALASFTSALGSAMVGVAVAFLAYQRSGSLVLTVLVLAVNALPALVLSPLVGRLTRYDPRVVDAAGQAVKPSCGSCWPRSPRSGTSATGCSCS